MRKFIGVICLAIVVLSGSVSCGKTDEPIVKKETPKVVEKTIPKKIEPPKITALDVYYKAYEHLVRNSTDDDNVFPTKQSQREAIKMMDGFLTEKEKYRMEKRVDEPYDFITYSLVELIDRERGKLPYDDKKYIKMYQKTMDFLNEREKKNGKLTSQDCLDGQFILMRNGADLDHLFYGIKGCDPKEYKFSIDDSIEYWKTH